MLGPKAERSTRCRCDRGVSEATLTGLLIRCRPIRRAWCCSPCPTARRGPRHPARALDPHPRGENWPLVRRWYRPHTPDLQKTEDREKLETVKLPQCSGPATRVLTGGHRPPSRHPGAPSSARQGTMDGAHYSPGERGKTKPLGAALALKAAGTALHSSPRSS
jgi:hypothetical protein